MAVQSHKGRHYFWEHVCFLQYFRLAEAEELMSEDLWSRWQESPPIQGDRAGLALAVGTGSLGDKRA